MNSLLRTSLEPPGRRGLVMVLVMGDPRELASAGSAFHSAVLAWRLPMSRWPGQRRHKQFSPPPTPSEETMPHLPARAGPREPAPSCAPASLCWASPGLPGDVGSRVGARGCPAGLLRGRHGGTTGLEDARSSLALALALQLLTAGLGCHQSCAQGGHSGTIWRHLTGHSAAGA